MAFGLVLVLKAVSTKRAFVLLFSLVGAMGACQYADEMGRGKGREL